MLLICYICYLEDNYPNQVLHNTEKRTKIINNLSRINRFWVKITSTDGNKKNTLVTLAIKDSPRNQLEQFNSSPVTENQ